MIRELGRMAAETHDVLVVGGGIQGVAIAREAARRGLSVALVEQDDFGAATSGNSQRMIHGGVRYLQNLDFARMRRSVLDRRAWIREFPDLVRPVPIVLPTLANEGKPRAVIRLGMALYDLLNPDQNAGLPAACRIPRHRSWSRAETLGSVPALAGLPVSGAVVFHDALVLDSERLTLEVAKRAWRAGARLANHARAIQWIRDGGKIRGAMVRDELDGVTHAVRASVVIHAGGPWAAGGEPGGVTGAAGGAARIGLVRAMALLVRPIEESFAIAVTSRREKRLFFLTPWHGHTLAGVDEKPHDGDPGALHPARAEVERFLHELNEALPGLKLALADVRRVFIGLLPVADDDPTVLAREDRVIEDDDGLVRVLGVKYTTAPSLARRVVDGAAAALGRARPTREDGEAAVLGSGIDEEIDVLRTEDPRWAEVLLERPRVDAAHVAHAIRREMARTLADVALRRTELAMFGAPPSHALHRAAAIAGDLLGWDEARRAQEIDTVLSRFVL